MTSLDELGNIALCLGVSMNGRSQKHAHLLHLDEPMCVLTRPCKTEGEFSVGKWYDKQQKSKQYKPVEDVLKTTLIQQISQNSDKTTIELILPVYFPPDLEQVSGRQFGQMPAMKDEKHIALPICPLFGPEGVECISPVKWSDNASYPACPTALLAMKINLSYSVGALPVWTPVGGQLKPWNFQEHPIVQQLCMNSCQPGMLVDLVTTTMPNHSNLQFGFILSKEAELAVTVFEEGEQISIGHTRHYWPIKLDIYNCPVVIALAFPPPNGNGENVDEKHSDLLGLHKLLPGDKFQFALSNFVKTSSVDSYFTIPYLGKIMDPFGYLVDVQIKPNTPIRVVATPHWNLAKASVVWFIDGCGSVEEKAVVGLKNTDKLEAIGRSDASHPSAGSSTKALEQVASAADQQLCATRRRRRRNKKLPAPVDEPKMLSTIAAFMAIRQKNNNPVFLFWDEASEIFVKKCYAQFDMSKSNDDNAFNYKLGTWFELKYSKDKDGQNQDQIIVHEFAETAKRVVTRVRDGICAQFSTNRDRFVNVWHAKFPCEEKDDFSEDKGWWPWLCRRCFPDLRDLNPGRVKKEENVSASLEKEAQKVHSLYASNSDVSGSTEETSSRLPAPPAENNKSSSPVAIAIDNDNNQSDSSSRVLAVLLTVRKECNGDSVFLIFDENTRKFTHRVYANPPKRIAGTPVVGKWYRLQYKLNSHCTTLQNGQKINVLSVGNPVKSAVQTRVVNGLAQFNTDHGQRFLTVWHKGNADQHESAYKYSRWWPSHCSICFSTDNNNSGTVPSKTTTNTSTNATTPAVNANSVEVAKARPAPIPVSTSFRRAPSLSRVPMPSKSKMAVSNRNPDLPFATCANSEPLGQGSGGFGIPRFRRQQETSNSSNAMANQTQGESGSFAESMPVPAESMSVSTQQERQKDGEPSVLGIGMDNNGGNGGETPETSVEAVHRLNTVSQFAAKANTELLGQRIVGVGNSRFGGQLQAKNSSNALANRKEQQAVPGSSCVIL